MKKIQVAIDCLDEKTALDIAEDVAEFVDILEVGTPLLVSQGMKMVRRFKKMYPDKWVFADTKIMDGGKLISTAGYDAGADMVSVLGVADNMTIQAVIDNARSYNRLMVVDLCSVSDLIARATEIEKMYPDYMGIHVGADIQGLGVDPIAKLKSIYSIRCQKTLAGGINLDTFEDACRSDAEIIILGSSLCKVSDRRTTAKRFFEIINRYR